MGVLTLLFIGGPGDVIVEPAERFAIDGHCGLDPACRCHGEVVLRAFQSKLALLMLVVHLLEQDSRCGGLASIADCVGAEIGCAALAVLASFVL